MAKLIGTDPYQVPTNADLGTMAYQDSKNTVLENAYINAKGADGLEMGRDYTSPNNSSRLFFNSSTATGNWAIFNNSGSLKIQSGAEAGSTSGNYTSVALSTTGMVLGGTVKKPNQPSIRMQRVAAGINIPTNASTSLAFDYTDHSAGITFNTSNNLFTVPVSGKYFISTNSRFNSHPAMNAELGIRINGTTRVYNYINQTSSTYHYFTADLIYEMSAGDYFDVYWYQGSGSTQSLSYNYQGVTAVQAFLMG